VTLATWIIAAEAWMNLAELACAPSPKADDIQKVDNTDPVRTPEPGPAP
jgi:hypothetical protein